MTAIFVLNIPNFVLLTSTCCPKIYDLGYTWAKGGSNVLLKNVILNRDPNVAAVIKGRWREMSKTLEYIEMIRNGVYSQ